MGSVESALKELGQLLISGFSGVELSDETAAFFSQANIGGAIYFAPNYESPAQIAELSNQLQDCRQDLPLWISLDQEGGRVQRFKKHFTKIPEAAAIGAMNSPKLAFEVGEVMARELAAVGVNLNYAPVADINTNPKNPVIGGRAFGSTEEEVTKMTTAIVRGHLVHKVQPCVKHFPGHGDTHTDSHFALPKVNTPLAVLEEREFKPFQRAFKSHCALVMTAHIILPALDPKFPATLSPYIIREILRKNMRFSGLVISDDMEMKAITDNFGAEDAPRLAIEAGCDLLIYRSESASHKAYESLTRDVHSGKLSAEIVLEAANRIKALKKEVLLPYHPASVAKVSQSVGTPEHAALMEKITQEHT